MKSNILPGDYTRARLEAHLTDLNPHCKYNLYIRLDTCVCINVNLMVVLIMHFAHQLEFVQVGGI
jgi:hypothetical protein